jgi:GT2 family glycosyltransferase
MSTVQIAVLITCHNRKDLTLACLRKLMRQTGIDVVRIQAYLVDAGSTDGTAEAIEKHFPNVRLIQRDSSLFWCGGMQVAFNEAMKGNYDYYLWLNDDTILFQNAIQMLLETAHELRQKEAKAGIIVGSTRDPKTGQCTYGGIVRQSRWRPLAYRLLEPSGKSQQCHTMNGNCVLIAREVAEVLGGLCPEFTHFLGDIDYGLRASAKGIPLWIASTYIGECSVNPPTPWVDPEVPLRKRLAVLYSPKGLAPREWLVFIRHHAGIYWPVYFLTLYVRVVFPGLWRLFGK